MMSVIDQRIEALRAQMKTHQLAAYIIPSSDPHQSEYVAPHWQARRWISGFTGSAGLVIITDQHAGLWTDSRYFIQAEQELQDSQMVLHKQKVPHAPPILPWLRDHLPTGARVGCDGHLMSTRQIERLQNGLAQKDIILDYQLDLLDAIWDDRPELPTDQIFDLPVTFTGKSREEKLAEIRAVMQEKDVDYHLVTTLDDIAWILNIRGSDIECNPVSIAYLLIGQQDAQLFINEQKIPAALQKAFQEAQVICLPYDQINEALAQLQNVTIYLDPATTNVKLYDALNHIAISTGSTISQAMKAIKNDTEVRHIRQAMEKDGVALVKLFRWLEATLPERKVPETEVAEQLIEFRRAQGDYHGESFAAIVGYKSNGAIVHYRAMPDNCAEIENNGILLLDSGGQYTNGTTDITRTIALSPPTSEQKRNYTLVLKGHIGLARLQFPYGTRGNQMEILARQHLWQHGLNYGHGTGHGVGFFLNVHEGPQALGTGATAKAATVFEAGMLTSNEPGYYEPGAYGIRIENLILAVESQETNYGQFLKFETLTLFPIDQQLIDTTLLSEEEKQWLDDYHEEVYQRLAPYLNQEEQAWLSKQCRALLPKTGSAI